MTSLNNGAPASALPAYLKSEIEALEEQLLGFADAINQPKNLGDAAFYIELQDKAEKKLAAKKAEYHAAILANLPEPEPLVPGASQPAPYPIDALPPMMRNAIKDIADFSQSPIALAGQCVLGAASYLAQTRVDAWSHLSFKMPCSLFLMALGRSGGGKSIAYDQAFAPILKAEKEIIQSYYKEINELNSDAEGLTAKELARHKKDNPVPLDPTTLITSDGSISRIMSKFVEGAPSLFWSTDEGGQMLGGHSLKADNRVAVLGSLTQLWDSGKGERLRSSENADASGKFWHRRFGLHLMAQEVSIRSALTDPIMREQGFLPRFLFCAPASLVGNRTISEDRIEAKPEDYIGIRDYWQRLKDIMLEPEKIEGGEIKADRLELTRGARSLWMDFWLDVEREQGRFGMYAELTPFASRCAQNALRVATVIAHFEGHKHVDDQAMKAALAIVNHSMLEWHRYACEVRVDKATQSAIDMSDWLIREVKAGKSNWMEFTSREWSRGGYSPLRKAEKRNQAFDILLSKNHLLTTNKGKSFSLNPLLLNPPATSATSATQAAKASICAVSNSFHDCDTTATHCDKNNPNAENKENVAACRNSVAAIGSAQSSTGQGLQGKVAIVAVVAPATGKKAIEVRRVI